MPLIAVAVAAIADIGVGVAGFSAVLAGTASMATTFAAIGAVGATIGAIGAVTHDKTLSTVGMVLGGIGGVGSLANAVGAFGEGATINSVFGSASAASTGAASAATPVAAAGGSFMDGAGAAADAVTPGVETVTVTAPSLNAADTAISGGNIFADMAALGGATPAAASTVSPENDPLSSTTKASPDQSAQSTAEKATAEDTGTTAKDADGLPISTAQSGTPTTSTPSSIPTMDKNWLNDQFPGGGTEGITQKAPSGSSYTFSNGAWAPAASGGIMHFLGTEGGGLMGMGVLQAAGSFLSGATDTLKPAQVQAYQAQAAANNSAAALTNKQVANMNQPLPTARRMDVTGKVGLMDSAPPKTGAAA